MNTTYKLAILASLLIGTSAVHASDTKFDTTLKAGDIAFHITCPNDSSLNTLTLSTSGLKHDANLTAEVEGTITDAKTADLNNDGAPEVYLFITSPGSGSYGNLLAYSANKKLSLSAIHFPEFNAKAKEYKGYMGHDKFSLTKDRLLREFPIYHEKDSNANPTGGKRVLEYTLVPGEAAWQLKLSKSTDSQ